MATEALIDGPARLNFPDYGEASIEKFSDICSGCAHSRADHLVPGSVDIRSVTDCNRCGLYAASNKVKANLPKCARFA